MVASVQQEREGRGDRRAETQREKHKVDMVREISRHRETGQNLEIDTEREKHTDTHTHTHTRVIEGG